MNESLTVIAARQGGVFSRRQALASGWTHDQIVRKLRDGNWERIRRGQYAEKTDLAALRQWERACWEHRRKVHAVMNSLRPGSVAVSHQSAMVMHGLPTWGLDLSHVHVTRLDGHSGGVVAGVQQHLGVLTHRDLTVVEGRLTTSVARAVVECACTTSFEVAVVGIDAALRSGCLDDEEAKRLQEVIEFWPGSVTARAALRFGNGLSESVGESRMRVFLHEHGFPEPELQAEFHDSHGFIGRVDFYLAGPDAVIEFDGAMKYGGGSPKVLLHEKRREDRLRALGLIVVRTDWSDLYRPADLATTLRQVFNRAHPAA